jgi:hypothetical protein
VALVLLLAAVGVGIGIAATQHSGNSASPPSAPPSSLPAGPGTGNSYSASPSVSASTEASSSTAPANGGGSSNGSGSGGYLNVPDVTGQPVDYAKQLLVNAGFSSGDIRVSYHCTSAGTGVYAQSPYAGSQARADALIKLTAAETDCVAYASEVGQPLATAQSDLKGFSNVSVVYVCVSGGTAGTVVAQSPAVTPEASYPPATPITLKVQQSSCTGGSASASAQASPAASPGS